MKTQPYYLVFDLDDTLLDTNQLRRRRARVVRELGGLAPARKRVLPDFKTFNIANFARAVFPRNPGVARQLIQAMNQGVRESKSYLYPGVMQFLQKLAQQHNLILVTYGDPSLQRRKLAYSGIGKFFSRIIITSESSKLKALRSLQAPYGNRLLFFENRVDTCRDARALGIKTFHLRSSPKDARYYRELAKKISKLWTTK